MKTLFDFIKTIKCDANTFYKLIRMKDSEKYTIIYIKKRNGQKRQIEIPNPDLKIIQKKILHFLNTYYYQSKQIKPVHGFVKDKDIVTNASAHLGTSDYIVKLDIKNFFTSITYERIQGLLIKGIKLPRNIANAICLLVTYDRRLPQGACTSPILSNMIFRKIDAKFSKFAKKLQMVYTRYADDITFSFNDYGNIRILFESIDRPPKVNSKIVNYLVANGFELNNNKTKILTKNSSQKICGIVVNNNLNVRRRFINDLRKEIYVAEKKKEKPTNKLIGKVSFLRHVKGKQDVVANKYAIKLNRLGPPPFPDADFIHNFGVAANWYIIRILTMQNNRFGSGFFANGFLITSAHVIETKDCPVRNYYDDIIVSYILNGVVKNEPCHIIKAFKWNEIAFLQIENYDKFVNRELKLTNEMPLDYNQKTYTAIGVLDDNNYSLGIEYHDCRIKSIGNYNAANCYILTTNSAYKGMSGGPLIDKSNYKVVGVIYTGPKVHSEKDGTDIIDIKDAASIVNRTYIKKSKLIVWPLIKKKDA